MHAIEGGAEKGPIVSASISAGSLVVLGLTVAAGLPVAEVSMVVAAVVAVALCYRTALRWHSLLAFLIVIVLFVPIKRYGLPGNLPFDLEPYRVAVALIMAGWIVSLLVDPRVRLRASGLEAPLALVFVASLGSVLVNGQRVDELLVGPEVIKALMFLLSYMLIFYLILSVVRTQGHVDALVTILVVCGGVVAFFATIESRTGFNVFDHLAKAIPLLTAEAADSSGTRGGRLRVHASAQGAIPLGAALAFLVPLAIYRARVATRAWPWWGITAFLLLGTLATGSRTGVIMLLVTVLVFLRLRPVETRKALAVLLLPAVILIHVALPGALGGLKSSFFPEGGLIAQQSQHAGWRGSGRIADIGPAMDEFVAQPLMGQGYATRQPGRERANAQILDDQWLKTLLEVGVLGVLAWLWLFARFHRLLAREARADQTERGWLLSAFAASVLAFAIGMFFYDAFAFIQCTMLLYVVLGLVSVLRLAPAGAMAPARAPRGASAAAAPAHGLLSPAPGSPVRVG